MRIVRNLHGILTLNWLGLIIENLGQLLAVNLFLFLVYHHVAQIFVLASHLSVCLSNHHVFSMFKFQNPQKLFEILFVVFWARILFTAAGRFLFSSPFPESSAVFQNYGLFPFLFLIFAFHILLKITLGVQFFYRFLFGNFFNHFGGSRLLGFLSNIYRWS
jgi:hypothetical protein